MKGFVIERVAVLIGILIFGYALTLLVKPLSDLIGIEDGIQFFLASIVFVSAWKATVKFFTEYPLKLSRFLSLAISFYSASFMLAAVWSITWRAFGYSAAYGDNGLRFMFRFVAICGSICAIAAPEFFEQEITANRLGKLAVGMACIVVTVLLLVYGHRIEGAVLHDSAPVIEGSP